MRNKFFISTIVVAVFCGSILAQQVIRWNEAHNYYGQYITVEGTIVNTYNSGKACFLNFHEDYRKYFTVMIFASDYSKFPPNPEDYYCNKKVQVTDIIKEYKGKPEIILKSSAQIKIINSQIRKDEETRVISWEDADKYYGMIVAVEGRIVATYNSGKACFLNFHRNWKRYFTAVIFKSDFHKFSVQPEEYYKDKKVRIKGTIKEYQGKPEIIIKSPSQIEVLKE